MPTDVSVILPFYNSGETLKNAVQSILDQTFKNFELILVDNNSTNKSRDIADFFQSLDSRVVILEEKKQGVANAMNRGLEYASGKYIARMDADDISLPERLHKQFNFIENNPKIAFCRCLAKFVSHQKKNRQI